MADNKEVKDEKFEQLSEAEQQALLEKYDVESNTRSVSGIFRWVIYFGLLAFSLFQLYTAIFSANSAYSPLRFRFDVYFFTVPGSP